jgi:GIY-YIG catalytic domain
MHEDCEHFLSQSPRISRRSNHPKNNLVGILKGLIHRAHIFCDKEEDLKKELELLKNVFIANGYPDYLVNRTIADSWKIEMLKDMKKTLGEKSQKEHEFIGVLNVPYINGFSEGLQGKLRKLRIGVTPKKGITLSHHLCKLKPPIPEEQRKNVVYMIPCKTCNQVYVGETGQKFQERRNQHKSDIRAQKPTNGIFEHLSRNEDHEIGWDEFTFVGSEQRMFSRKIRESIVINAMNPQEKTGNIMNLEKGLELSSCWTAFQNDILRELAQQTKSRKHHQWPVEEIDFPD